MRVDVLPLLLLGRRDFVAPQNGLAASEPALDPSSLPVAHNLCYASGMEEERLADGRDTCCCTLGELEDAVAVAVAVDIGSPA